ncbi:MAG: hypothetical protein AAGU23_07035 [Bacillota bacterium]
MQDRLKRIHELKNQLLDLGYHSFQVDSIVKEAAGRINESIDAYQAACIIESLEDYLHFAHKCKKPAVRA